MSIVRPFPACPCAAALVAVAVLASPSPAASLADQLQNASKTGNLANALVTQLVRTAVRGADFPATATTASFTYEFDFALASFRRSSTSLGPEFMERSETIGKGRFDIGVLYLFANFATLDGNNLEGSRLGPETFKLSNSGAIITQEATFSKFTLASNVVSFNGTYGLTDHWDVNVLVPIVSTTLDAAGVSSTRIAGNVSGISQPFGVDDSAFGVGDVLLRTKYRLADTRFAKMAAGLTARLPTGNEDNFQGLGDFVLTPLFIASRAVGQNDVHLNVGFDIDAQHLGQSRVRYAVGVTLHVVDRVAFLLDFLGSSGVVDNTFTTESGQTAVVARSDDVFAAPGLKIEILRLGGGIPGCPGSPHVQWPAGQGAPRRRYRVHVLVPPVLRHVEQTQNQNFSYLLIRSAAMVVPVCESRGGGVTAMSDVLIALRTISSTPAASLWVGGRMPPIVRRRSSAKEARAAVEQSSELTRATRVPSLQERSRRILLKSPLSSPT